MTPAGFPNSQEGYNKHAAGGGQAHIFGGSFRSAALGMIGEAAVANYADALPMRHRGIHSRCGRHLEPDMKDIHKAYPELEVYRQWKREQAAAQGGGEERLGTGQSRLGTGQSRVGTGASRGSRSSRSRLGTARPDTKEIEYMLSTMHRLDRVASLLQQPLPIRNMGHVMDYDKQCNVGPVPEIPRHVSHVTSNTQTALRYDEQKKDVCEAAQGDEKWRGLVKNADSEYQEQKVHQKGIMRK